MLTTIAKTTGYSGSYIPDNWYAITLTTAQTLDLDLAVSLGSSGLSLYDASGTVIENVSANTVHDGSVTRTLAAGLYYVDVTNQYVNALYALTVATGSPAVGAIGVDMAGSTLATARALGTIGASPVVVTDAIGGGDTDDYYSFNVAAGPTSALSLVLSGLSSDATLDIRNASGNILVTAYGGATSNASINDDLAYLTPGTYFVEVYSSSSTPTGYNLSLIATPTPNTAGATLSTARSMGTLSAATSSFSDELTASAGTEYYSFSLSAASFVTLRLLGLTDNETLTLRDATGNQLLSASGSFSNGTIDLTDYLATLSLGTYYVSVTSAFNSTEVTPYTLTAQATAVAKAGGTSLAAAVPLGTIGAAPVVKAGYLGTVNLADYYSFNLASAATVYVTFSANFDEYLTLFSASGATLVGATHESNGTLNAAYTLAAGTYSLLAQPASGGEDEDFSISLSTTAPSVGNSASANAGATIATAKSLGTLTPTPVNVADYVGAGNTDDWYTVTLATAGTLEVDLTGNTSGINLYVLTATGASVDSDGGGTGSFTGGSVVDGASIIKAVAAGTYYVHVQDATSSSNTGYHLAAMLTPSGGGSVPDLAGNTTATALNIGTLGSTPQSFTDYVGSTDTDDYYQFTLTGNATVDLRLESEVNSNTTTYLTLRDISGNVISTGYEYYHYDGDIQKVLTPGIYFADVNNTTSNVYKLTLSATPLADTSSSARSTAASFLPTAASIAAQIDQLEPQVKAGALSSILLGDGGVPTISITYAQAVADIDVLKAIATPYILNLNTTPDKYDGATLMSLGLGGTAAQSVQFSDGRLVFSTTDPAAQVYRMFLSAFGRVPDQPGQHSWDTALETGTPLLTMAQSFITSPEFAALYGTNVSNTAFVTNLYQNVLGRAPDSSALTAYVGALAAGATRAQLLVSFSESAEHIAETAPAVAAGVWDLDEISAQVARLYDTVFGRLPDPVGLAGWSNAIRAGAATISVTAAAFVSSPEFQAIYGTLTNTQFMTQLYLNTLHRAADPAGLAAWVNALNGGLSRSVAVLNFSESPEHQADTASNIVNNAISQAGILTTGPVAASGSVIGGSLDAIEAQVRSHAITSLTDNDSGVSAVPVTTAQLSTDKDALSFLGGNFILDMHTVSTASGGPAAVAANLGTTTAAKYVQFADGRLVYDLTDRAAQVYRLYDSAFGHTPDTAGEHSWSAVLASGTPLSVVAQAFMSSPEFIARYGAAPSDTTFVNELYTNVLHHAGDAASLTTYVAQLGSGTETRAQLLASFSESAEHVSNTAAAIRAGVYDIG